MTLLKGRTVWKRCAAKLVLLLAIAGLFFTFGPVPSAYASCVVNATSVRIFVEYYGKRVATPTFDRGGQWVGPGERRCIDGVGGDWLVLPPEWISGKPPDWARRERDRLGGTQAQPRYYPIYVTVAVQGIAEIKSFVRFKDKRGWWVKAVATHTGTFRFTLDINGAESDYVFVNDTWGGTYVRAQRSGRSGPINLSLQMRRESYNTIEIWREIIQPIVTAGTEYILKRDGRVILAIPASLTKRGPHLVPGPEKVASLRINRKTGEVAIRLNWGAISGCQGTFMLDGWQPSEDFMNRRPCLR